MQNFDYFKATTVGEAVSLLDHDDAQTYILCGGTDLIVQMREGRVRASKLIDIKAIPEVNEICFEPGGGLRIGAGVPCYRICSHPDIRSRYPGLVDAVALIGGVQIQGRASLGGNLCNASPSADSVPALIAHQSNCFVAGPAGTRTLPVEQFCIAPGKTVLKRGEFLVEFHLPPPPPHFGASYLRFIPRNEMDIAVAGVGVSITLQDDLQTIAAARIALAAVAPTPLFVPEAGEFLVGRNASDEAFREAARIARQSARPISDIRGTASQRQHLVEVLTRRALEIANRRATE